MDDPLALMLAPLAALLALRLVLGAHDRSASWRLRAALFEHLALTASRGLPLGPAIDALARERERGAAPGRRLFGRRDPARAEAELLRALAARLQATGSLVAALEDVRDIAASPGDVQLLRAAEQRGALPEALAAIDREHEARADARRGAIELGTYPAVLALLVGFVSVFLYLAIIPKFREIAADMPVLAEPDFELPVTLTAALVGLFSLLLVDEVMLRRAGRAGRAALGLGLAAACRAPLVGPPLRRRLHARWLHRAAALLGAGATLPEALDAAATLEDGPSRPDLRRAADLAAQGHALRPVLAAALGRDADAVAPQLLLAVDGVGVPDGLRAGADRLARVAGERLLAAGRVLQVAPVLLCAAVVAAHSMAVWGFISAVEATILGEVR